MEQKTLVEITKISAEMIGLLSRIVDDIFDPFLGSSYKNQDEAIMNKAECLLFASTDLRKLIEDDIDRNKAKEV